LCAIEPDAEEGSIGGKLSAGHTLHAEADLQFLDAVFGHLAALAIPDQGCCGRLDAVTAALCIICTSVLNQ
jgi:hypothetical protein